MEAVCRRSNPSVLLLLAMPSQSEALGPPLMNSRFPSLKEGHLTKPCREYSPVASWFPR